MTETESQLKRYQALMKNALDGVHVMDMQGNVVEVNDSFCRMLGYTPEEAIKLNIADWNSQWSKEELLARLKNLAGKSARFETVHQRKDGTLINVEISTTSVEIGGHFYYFASSSDITERKKAEEALKTREERFQALFDRASEGILIVSTSGKLIAANESFARMHGYTPQEMQSMNLKDLDPPDSLAQLPERMRRLLAEGFLTFEVENYHKDGHTFPMEVSASLIVVDGEPVIQSFSRDITERKLAEKKIRFLSQIYAAQSQTNQALIESKDETTLFNRICQIVVEFGGIELSWIGVKEEKTGRIKPVSAHGSQTDYLSNIEVSSRVDVPEGRGPTGTAFREMRSIFVEDQKTDPMLAHWRRQTIKYGWGSLGAVPIIRNGESYAVLVFYHTSVNIFTEEIIDLLNEMARNIGRGLDRFDLEMAKQKSQESAQLAAKIYQTSIEAIMVTDENNLIIEINPAFTAITGYLLEEVIGKSPKLLQSGKHNNEFYREMWQSILNNGHWQGEIWDRRKNGELHAKQVNISVIRHPDGSIYRHVAQFSDITEKKQKEELIWKQANFDTLTNLPNRHMFRDRLEQEIVKAKSTGLPMALLFIDLDRFKEINDTLGHSKGDGLLVEAAHRIKMCVRITDLVARLGGDEFTVILSEFGDRLHLEHIVQDLINELAKPFDLGEGHRGFISASIGITIYPDDAEDIGNLLKNADQAMYAAKAEGRNRFSYFTQSMQQEAREKLALTNDLRDALARNELHVYYQPIIELQSKHIAKAEALLRWKHPTRGMVSPAVFIPLAEESGLIHEIGDWVFQEAVAHVADWQKLCGCIIQISVNKSPVQFEQPASRNWQNKMKELGVPGNGIAVEITEGLLLKESSKAKEQLLEYRNNGIEVSIDDFGTGFSSLSYLKQFDIDYLKIDRSFVKDMEKNADDKALTEAIIVMAHKLGIKTIAEGVETEEQRDLLISFGCDYVQGFLYSPAVPAAEFEKIIVGKTVR